MEPRQNCWEYMKCGREPGGKNVEQLGVCPAATDEQYNDINRGNAAGRCCWLVAGTLCEGEVQGTFAQKFGACLNCPFMKEVERQEDRNFTVTKKTS